MLTPVDLGRALTYVESKLGGGKSLSKELLQVFTKSPPSAAFSSLPAEIGEDVLNDWAHAGASGAARRLGLVDPNENARDFLMSELCRSGMSLVVEDQLRRRHDPVVVGRKAPWIFFHEDDVYAVVSGNLSRDELDLVLRASQSPFLNVIVLTTASATWFSHPERELSDEAIEAIATGVGYVLVGAHDEEAWLVLQIHPAHAASS